MADCNKRKLGDDIEAECILYLQSQGITSIIKNFRNRYGEIDIIGYDKAYLVFFEVKYRVSNRAGYAEEAADYRKQWQICRVSDFFRVKNKISEDVPMRYDVLAVNNNKITWYKNAFEYISVY